MGCLGFISVLQHHFNLHRLLGKYNSTSTDQHEPVPYAPCMVYLPTLGSFFRADVGKYSIHGAYWIIKPYEHMLNKYEYQTLV